MISSIGRRWPGGLRLTRMSPRVGSVAKKPELGAGAADVAGDVGRLLEHGLDPPQRPCRSAPARCRPACCSRARTPLVHVGHEAGLEVIRWRLPDRDRQPKPARHDRQQRQQHDRRGNRRPTCRAPRSRRPAGCRSGRVVGIGPAAQEARRQHRDDRQADDHRDQQRHGQRDAQRLEELADHPAHEGQRQEDEDRRQGRADHRAADLAAGPVDGLVAGLPLGQMPGDVLDHDHRSRR